jgi:toxin YhaV
VPLVVNGWTILYYPPVFGRQYAELRGEIRRLKRDLPEDRFRQHPKVKLGASIHRLVTEIVPVNPDDPSFRLAGDLSAYRRAKGRGLPPRYRLFWVFSSQARTIIFLYFNDESTLRKAGSDRDPYEVFRSLVRTGAIGSDFSTNLRVWEEARR